jgi:hypothetical protein
MAAFLRRWIWIMGGGNRQQVRHRYSIMESRGREHDTTFGKRVPGPEHEKRGSCEFNSRLAWG